MKLIALETSAKTASAAVVTEGKLLGVSSVTAGLTHSQTILPLLETLLKGVSMELSDADGFAVSIGPGSFTGLRIGISAVKGMAQGLGKGCAGISTLEGLAWNFQGLHYTVCPVMDARCGQVYTSLFWVNGGRPQRLWEDMGHPAGHFKGKAPVGRRGRDAGGGRRRAGLYRPRVDRQGSASPAGPPLPVGGVGRVRGPGPPGDGRISRPVGPAARLPAAAPAERELLAREAAEKASK